MDAAERWVFLRWACNQAFRLAAGDPVLLRALRLAAGDAHHFNDGRGAPNEKQSR